MSKEFNNENIDSIHRIAELSSILYFNLIKNGYLDSSHLSVAKNVGKFALALNVSKQMEVALFDVNTSFAEQATEIIIDIMLEKLPAGPLIAIKSIELFGNHIAPVLIDDVEMAVSYIAKTEEDIFSQLSPSQKIALQTEFTLSEEMQEAIAWVKGVKYLAEKMGQAKKWLGKQVQEGVNAVDVTLKNAAKNTFNEELAEEYREAAGVFTLINLLSEKIKSKDSQEKIDKFVEQNYALDDEESLEEVALKGSPAFFAPSAPEKSLKEKLNPKFGVEIVGATSAGLAVIGKISMNLTAVSIGIGAAFFAACNVTSLIFRRVQKKKSEKCQKHDAANFQEVNNFNQAYRQLIIKYQNLYRIGDIDNFMMQATKLKKNLDELKLDMQAKRNILQKRNSKIHKKSNRKEYKTIYRQHFDEMRAYYDNVSESISKIHNELNHNLEVVEAFRHQLTCK